MRTICTALLMAAASLIAGAQPIETPVQWSYSVEDAGDGQAALVFTADIAPGWYLYSQYLDEGGPIATTIHLYESDGYELVGKTEEEGPKVEGMDALFGMHIVKYKKQAVFTQRIKVKEGLEEVGGYIEFMTCDEEKCLPPTEVEFTFSFRK